MKMNLFLLFFFVFRLVVIAQPGTRSDSDTSKNGKGNDVSSPLHALKPDNPIPYGAPATSDVEKIIDRIYKYLDAVTPAQFIDKKTGRTIHDYSEIDTNTIFQTGDFRLTSYEWGVTYSGMLEASAATGNPKYLNYTRSRLSFLADAVPAFQ